jgi:hypothetical protein
MRMFSARLLTTRLGRLGAWLLLALSHLTSPGAGPEWLSGEGFRWQPLPAPKPGKTGLTLLPPTATGVTFTNTLSHENASRNQIRLNGSGVALGDVDGDERCDIFLCSLEGRLALYRNLGDWRFTNVTASAGLDLPGNDSTGATFADVDGDGDLDLLVNGIGSGTRLFLNDSQGHFTEATNSGLLRRFGAMTSALADIAGPIPSAPRGLRC